MNSEFLPDAEDEFREATRYYETEAPGVGVAFIAEVRKVVRWIREPVCSRSGRQRAQEQDSEPLSVQYPLCRRARFDLDRSRRSPETAAEVLEGKD